MNRTVKGYLYTILSAVIFGCIPIAAKITYANGLNSMSLVFFRNLLAVPILYGITKMKGESLRLSSKSEVKQIVILALLSACITPLLLFSSYSYIPAGTSTTFHFIYPAMTILGGVLLFRQKVTRGQVLCVLLCTFGITLFYTPGQPLDPFGSAIALCSGVTYALYILFLDHFPLKSISRFKLSMYISCICSVVMLPFCLVTGNFSLPGNLLCWVICILLAVLAGAGASVLFQLGTQLIGGQRSSILSTFEPITSIVLGVLAFHEPLTWRNAAGTVCVLAATALIAVLDAKAKQPAKAEH